MTKKLREFKRSFGQEKARVKLYKSGKNWVKAGIKEIQLLRLMGLPFLTEKVEKEDEGPQNIGGFIKRNALKTTALTGGMFTVNMLHDQHAFAASEAPVTSELTTQSQTVGDQTSVTIEQSQSTTDSQASTSVTSDASTSTASESSASSERQTSTDSQSTSTKDSQSTSTDSQSTSTKDSQATSTDSQSMSTKDSRSTSSDSKSQSTSSESTSKSTSTSDSSSTSSKSGSQSTGTTSTSATSTSASLSTSDSTSQSTAPLSLRSLSLRAAPTTFAAVAATAPVTQTYTGTGTDTLYKLPIYYKLIVTSDGTALNFTYYVSYDNPNTATVEVAPLNRSLNVKNTNDSLKAMLNLGSGYGQPSAVTQSITTAGYTTTNESKITPATTPMQSNGSGYYWQGLPAMNGTYARLGDAIMAKWSVPITNPNGDLNWTFSPYASRTGATLPNYFTGAVTGNDPVTSTSLSNSTNASISASTSTSLSNSRSASLSTSLSASQSASTSASLSTSLSESESASTSLSESESESISTSISE